MSNTFDTGISTLSDEEREILAFWMKQERQEKVLAQQIKPRQSTDNPPLSFAQQRLWVVEQMADTGTAYNLSMGLHISGPLRIDLLQKCLDEIVRRHEVLRSSIGLKDGEPVQFIHPPAPIQVEITDLSAVEPEQLESGKRKFLAEAVATVFDLARGPLIRSHLLRLEQQEHIFVICMHHIVTDAWSFNLLQREFSVLYEVYLSGNSSPLPELKVQYADYSIWQRNWLAGEEYKRQLDYWREQLKDLTTLELPTDRIRPALPSFKGGMAGIKLETELKQSLVKLAQQEDVTLFILLLTVFTLLLHKYSGQDDIVLGSPVANRSRIETEELIGFFVNMLVLRTDLSDNPGFRELLAQVRDMAFEAYAHQDLPIERMVEELKIVRDMSRNPLFQVSFALQEKPDEATQQVGDLSLSPAAAGNPTVRFDLELYLTEGKQDLNIFAVYNTDLFDAETIDRMLSHYRSLLEDMVASPNTRIGDAPMLSEQERRQILIDWNHTTSDYPRDRTVQALFEEQVSATPDACAVEYDGDSLSYSQLNERANRLAHYMRQQGVGPEVKVGLFLERSLEMVVAVLGIVKAGGAYVPLDLDYPASRIAFMLEDAQVSVLISTSNLTARLPELACERVCLDSDWVTIEQEPADNLGVTTIADSLAYVIYTSGSTGTPKGVEIAHRAINRLVRNTDYYQADATDRIAQASSISFDAATFELWGALLNGAQLVGVSKDTLLNSKALAALLQEKGVTAMFITTAVFNQVARELPGAFGCLKGLMFGGEAVDCNAVREVLKHSPSQRLLHVYGPTESTTFASWHPIESLADDATTVPIGRPLANTTLYVLDATMNPVPVGVSGELYIGGDGLARGYLNQAELTAERFVANPFDANGQLYRTGDKVRYRTDGAIEFQGRFDHQIKLRGFRIELGEIETALVNHAALQDAVAIVREDEPGDKRLHAYVVPTPEWIEQNPSVVEGVVDGLEAEEPLHHGLIPELRQQLRQQLPPYMLPSVYVVLDVLPLNPNGKVDRKALPVPGDVRASLGEEYTAPRSELEQQLVQIWAEVLKLERVGIHDNFFDLGGHSLMATQVVSRVRAQLNVELPLSEVFRYPTVAELAPLMEALLDEHGAEEVDVIPVADRNNPLPLSFAQERLWFLDQLEPGNPAYNIPMALRLKGELSVSELTNTLNWILQRHEVLRTRFENSPSGPVQVIDEQVSFDLVRITLSDLPAEAQQKELMAQLQGEAIRPFDIASDLLLRGILLRLGEGEHVLLLTVHHIIADGWSLGVLFRELGVCYAAFRENRRPQLADLPIQYADFAVWQRDWLSGAQLERQLGYWSRQLADLTTLDLPTDFVRPPMQSYRGAHLGLSLGNQLSTQLETLSKRSGNTLFMTMLGAYALMMHRYSSQDDVVIGSPIANRNRAELEGLIAFFVNMLVLRLDCSGNPGFAEFMKQLSSTVMAAFEHQDIPFEKLVEVLQAERDPSRNPLFQVHFTLQNAPMERLDLAGLTLESVDNPTQVTRFDLECHIWPRGAELEVVFIYNTDLFEAATIERMLGHYRNLLKALVLEPERPIDSLSMLDEEEIHLLKQWNQVTSDHSSARTLFQLFEAQVDRDPDAVAVELSGEMLSYGELEARSNQLARYLQERGVSPEVLVGLYLERSLELLVAILGILKAGGAYVPLDPEYPSERLAFMLEDCAAPILLTQIGLQAKLPDYAGLLVRLDTDWPQIDEQDKARVSSEVAADNAAYVIYTSGSTGQPKGVIVTHGNVTRLFGATSGWYGFNEKDVWTLFHSSAFDFSVWEVWGALLHGGRLVVVPYTVSRSPELFHELLVETAVTVLNQTPSAFRQLIEADMNESTASLDALRFVILGGEALDPRSLQPWFENHAEQTPQLVNMYGITETTVHVSYRPLTSSVAERNASVIGRAIPDLQIYILDRLLQPVPIGVPGEMYVGGAGLARGYLNRPELTLERFIADPFSENPGVRLYKTGDLGRYLSDGDIEYLGRTDHQVKLRGFRIELGEIEIGLGSHEAIREVVVVAREDQPGDKRLVAFLVAAQAWLERCSPSYSGEHVNAWQTLYEETYCQGAGDHDARFNIVGWNSSYTSEPIAAEQMREWVDVTVARISALRAQRVLEIGCGTGLLLYRLAPGCARYVGADFSAVAQQQLGEGVAADEELRHVELWHRSADDFSGIGAGDFDLVVINSVVQYLPSVDYLLEMLSGAVAGVGDGGHVFVGDLRSFPLLSAYHASVEAHRAPQDVTGLELLGSVQQRVEEENELVVEPAFFHALKQRVPRISHVEVLLKRGEHINELSAFRYDVILHVEAQPTALASTGQWHDWGLSGYNEAELNALLAPLDQDWLGIHAIPNARYAGDLALLEQLQGEHAALALPDLKVEIEARVAQAINPAHLWRLAESCGYELELGYTGSGADGRMEALFRRGVRADRADKLFWDQAQTPGERRWTDYANNPLKGGLGHELIPQLKDDLRQSLPDYMLPSAFVFLDTLPMTPSGKVDRKALPRPKTQQRKRVSSNRPETEMEIILAAIWEELLEIEDIETDDMFFDLGGHSLLTIKVIDRFDQQANVRIPVASFMSQTLRQIAASAEASLEASGIDSGKELDTPPDNDSKKGSGGGFLGLFKRK